MKTLKWRGQGHLVKDESLKNYMVDMHSHGLEDEIGTEFQYVIDRGEKENFGEIQDMFSEAATKVLNNELQLKDGEIYTSELFSCDLKLFKTKDSANKSIFRIIEPDLKGNFPETSDKEWIKCQYESPYKEK